MTTITLPGLIDCHVHFREPGFPEKATMATEAASAKAGGVTTVCEMPNTSPPTVTVAALEDKVRRAGGVTDCDIRFFFGVTERAHIAEFRRAWTTPALRARLAGVKVYFDHSTGNQAIEEAVLGDVFAACAELGATLVGHCEDPATNAAAAAAHTFGDISVHALRRPPRSEEVAVERAIALAERHGARFHVAHLSTAAGIALVAAAKQRSLPVTCEVAPHHIFLTVDDFAGLGPLAKMNPPLRSERDRDALWKGIADGTVDCIATDHAPHTLAEKRATDPAAVPSGVPGVETTLPLLLTVAAGGWPHPSSRRPAGCALSMEDIARLCFENPNRIFALGKNRSAEAVVVDPAADWTLRGADLHAKCGWTPFEGWAVRGKALRVVRGG